MVVSRSDAKRRRKEGNVLDSSLRESPKRAKVHAQRKFAQGSSNPNVLPLTPIKDKEKVKSNGAVLSSELIPTKRPRTEDFLTFLCFRGTSLLPPSLDLFSVASTQESQEEDASQHGDSGAREGVRSSRATPTIPPGVTAQRTSRSNDRIPPDNSAGQGVAGTSRNERLYVESKRRPSTAVQALRRKYQEQRLAKHKVAALRKLAQKVKGKNMMRTRSSTLKEQAVKVVKPTAVILSPAGPLKRTGKGLQLKKKHSTAAARMITRGRTGSLTSPHDAAEGRRREGLRSGNLSQAEDSPVMQRSQRVVKVTGPTPLDPSTSADKEKQDKRDNKVFASTVSDFSSDDDQPLVKKAKPVESSQQQHARKVVKRLVQSARKVRSRVVTRSRVHKQDDAPVVSVRTPSTRPTRKTKEAAALYMELLGKKLATSDADLDDDSLSVDSFPELPNARQNERRENELKARAMKLLETSSGKLAEGNNARTPSMKSQKSGQPHPVELGAKAADRSRRDEKSIAKKYVVTKIKPAAGDKAKGVAVFRSKRIFVRNEKLQSAERKNKPADKKLLHCVSAKKLKHLENEFMKEGKNTQNELVKKEKCLLIDFVAKKNYPQSELWKKKKFFQGKQEKEEQVQKGEVVKENIRNEVDRKEKLQSDRYMKEKLNSELKTNDKRQHDAGKKEKLRNEAERKEKQHHERERKEKLSVDVEKKPISELERKEKHASEIAKKEKQSSEISKKEKQHNEIEKKEKSNIEVEKKEKHASEIAKKEKHAIEIAKKEKHAIEITKKEKQPNEIERKENRCTELDKKENPLSDNNLKEKQHNETERKEKFLQIDIEKSENCPSCPSKKDVFEAGMAKKENNLPESLKKIDVQAEIRCKNIATDASVKDKSGKVSVVKHMGDVVSPRRSQRHGLQLSKCVAEKIEMQKSTSKGHQITVHCKINRLRELGNGSEDKFSDSDEEPLGKIALKSAVSFESFKSDKFALNSVKERLVHGDSTCKKGVDRLSAGETATVSCEKNSSLNFLADKRKVKSEELRKVYSDGKNVRFVGVRRVKNVEPNDHTYSTVETKKGNKLVAHDEVCSVGSVDKVAAIKKCPDVVRSNIGDVKIPKIIDEQEFKKLKDMHCEPTITKIPLVSVSSIDLNKIMKTCGGQKFINSCALLGCSNECTETTESFNKCTKPQDKSVCNTSFPEEEKPEAKKEHATGDVKVCAHASSSNCKVELEMPSCSLVENEIGIGTSTETGTKEDRENGKVTLPQQSKISESHFEVSAKNRKEHGVHHVEQPTSAKSMQLKIFGKRKNRRKLFRKSNTRGVPSDKPMCKVDSPCRRNTLKRHMKKVSRKTYFEMNNFSSMQMFTQSKSQHDNSAFENASNLSSSRVDVDKEASKFDSTKTNFFSSSPLKASSPVPSQSKKSHYKDLKSKRKVNMSTEQIEKWLNESYIEDAQEEKECGLCSKTDCKCSASSIDEELAHLSQFAMEKLTLGSGSECDVLEEGRKKSSLSIDGTPCYLQDDVDCQVNQEAASASQPDQLENGPFVEAPEAMASNSKEEDLELESLFNNSFATIENIDDSGKRVSVKCLDAGEGSDIGKVDVSQHGDPVQTIAATSTSEPSEVPVDISGKSVDALLDSSVSCMLPSTSIEISSEQVLQPLELLPSQTQQPLVSSQVSLPSTIFSYSEQVNPDPQNSIVSSHHLVTSSNQVVSAHDHSGLQSTSLVAPLYQQAMPSTLPQSIITTAHQPVVFITSQSSSTGDITMEEPKSTVIPQSLQQAVNLLPQADPPANQHVVDQATQQSLHKVGDIMVQQVSAMGQQNNSSLMMDAAAVQVSMPSVQQTMISSIHRSAVSSFHPTVSLPFQELTQCISSPAQQATRTITLPIQQPIGQLFQHSVNNSFQQAGGIIIQPANPSQLQQSISLQAMGLPCHQTVTLPLQQLTFVPIKSMSLQLQQQLANIPLQQTIASTLPQTVSASLHTAMPLHQAANVHLQQTNSILFHQHTQLQPPPGFQQQVTMAPSHATSPPRALPQSSDHVQQPGLLHSTTPQILQQLQAEPKQLISVQTSLAVLPQMCAKLPSAQVVMASERPTSPPNTLSQSSDHVQQPSLLPATTPQILQQLQAEPKQLISVQTSLAVMPHICAKMSAPQVATLLPQSAYQLKTLQQSEPCLQQSMSGQASLQEVDLNSNPPKELAGQQHTHTSVELNTLPSSEVLQTCENVQQDPSLQQNSCLQSLQSHIETETMVKPQPVSMHEQTLPCTSETTVGSTSLELPKQQLTYSEQVVESAPTVSLTFSPPVSLEQELSLQVPEPPSRPAALQEPKAYADTRTLPPVVQPDEVKTVTPEPVAEIAQPLLSLESAPSQQLVQPEVSHSNQSYSKEVKISEQPESKPKANVPQLSKVEFSRLQPASVETVGVCTVVQDDLESLRTCIGSQVTEQNIPANVCSQADLHQHSGFLQCASDKPKDQVHNEDKDAGREQSSNSHSGNLSQLAFELPCSSVNDLPDEVNNTVPSTSVKEHSSSSGGPVKQLNKMIRSLPSKESIGSLKNEKICEKHVTQKASGLRVMRFRKDMDKDHPQERKHHLRTTQSQTVSGPGTSEKAKSSKFYSKFIVQRGSSFKLLGEKSVRGFGRRDYLSIRKQRTPTHVLERKSIFQKSRPFPQKVSEQKKPAASTNAFSLEDESSVYAFKTELELPPINTPFRRHARDSRTSSTTTSRSEEDLTRALDDELPSPLASYILETGEKPSTSSASQQTMPLDHSSTMPSSKCLAPESAASRNSTSIAVQVNLDTECSPEPCLPSMVVPEPSHTVPTPQRSTECSTQTEVSEEDDNDGHLFYIPLQQAQEGGKSVATSQQLIQGVTVKLGTEGSAGSNQCVIMRAKLVTKPPSFSCAPAVQDSGGSLPTRRAALMPPHQRSSGILMVEQKLCSSAVPPLVSTSSSSYPPVGTVQPTARARPQATATVTTRSDATTGTGDQARVSDSGSQTAVGPGGDGGGGALPRVAGRLHQRLRADVFPMGRRRSQEQASSSSNSQHKVASNTFRRSLPKSKAAKSCEVNYLCTPVSVAKFPAVGSRAQLVEAPIYHPTEKEFQDPLEYIDKIRPVAEKFGLCRIVPPPNFKPECKVTDDMRFTAYNQYVHKMLHRWGPNVMELMAIKKYLATQSIALIHPPLIGGMEVDLPRLYQTVQSLGGLKDVIEKKKWQRVAECMRIPKSAQERATKLDDIYCKYLLPYDTLSPVERSRLFAEVEKEWQTMESASSSTDCATTSDAAEEEVDEMTDESHECIVKGRTMALNAFYRIARNTMSMWFRQPEPSAAEVEQEFWKHVTMRQCHVCVHSGSIDSSGWGYGFPCSKNSPFARHPWNLKVLTNNSGSILRSMGPIMGVTVPTLHVGMVFTTCCWYRDPHGLPWIEYLHTGARKIWYGIPDEYSFLFRAALSKLVPRYCRNKTIWLPSDTAMVPPSLLVQEGVSLCHTVQEPGQFILVFPRAFTSSICSGYLVSESVYFAQPSWLSTAQQVFKDIQESCEPSVFSLERLLFSIATDSRSHVDVLKQVLPMVLRIRQQELDNRKELYALGLKSSERLPLPDPSVKRRKSRPAPRDDDGDYECEICRANLFVSLVTNSHEEGVYCLPHASQLLSKKRHHLKFCKLMYTYDQSELNELVQKLEDRIEVKSHRKPLVKHCSSGQKT